MSDHIVERDGIEVEFCDDCGEEMDNCWCDDQDTCGDECENCGEMAWQPHGECLNCGYMGDDGEGDDE